MMIKISNHLIKETESKSSRIIDIVQPMQAKFDKYWGRMELFSAISLVFDPRYKLELIKFMCLEDSSSNRSTTIQPSEIKDRLYQWYNEFAALVQKVTSQTPHSACSFNKSEAHQKKKDNGYEAQFWIYVAGKRNNTATLKTAELGLYLQEATIENEEEGFDLLNWWKINKLWLPVLARLAKRILATPVISIALESAFSTGGRVLSDSRCCVNPETLEALICAQDWINTNEGLYNYDAEDEISALE